MEEIDFDTECAFDVNYWLHSEEAGDLQRELEEKIVKFLFSGGLYRSNLKNRFLSSLASPSLRPPASLNLFKLSCFGTASLPQICGASFAKFPILEVTSV